MDEFYNYCNKLYPEQKEQNISGKSEKVKSKYKPTPKEKKDIAEAEKI